MFFYCNASFVACALLSTFTTITRKERDAVQFVLELISYYDGATGRLRMTFDAHVLAQIYLAELRTMAGRHSYTHDGSLEEAPQARALLSVIVMPLIRHLSAEECNDLLESMDEADYLLSRPLEVLEELVFTWRVQNESITTDWRSYPIGDLNSYEFGVELPANVVLEDLLAPLPYPTKPRRSMIHYISEHSEDQFPGTQAFSFDSAKTMMDPQCESTKELELKEKPKFKFKPNVFAISSFVRSRGSFDSRSEYSYGSDSSGMPWASTCEVVEKESEGMGDQESVARSGYIFNCANHRDTEMKIPRHKLLARRLKRVFRCA